jgi:nucleoside-diphosphate-sugar epimerase
MKILLTGANGFVGQAIAQKISKIKNIDLSIAVRNVSANFIPHAKAHDIKTLDSNTNWEDALFKINIVIHTAARVHIMNETSNNSLAEFRKINVEGTLNLARQAIAAGVKRFIFISSIKVNGENTKKNKPFKADDKPAPNDSYAISKLEAEQGLLSLAATTGIEVVIVRPVLIYGFGVKANFLSMIRWLDIGIPLPLGGIKNLRSMISLDNLVDFLLTCLSHPAASGQIFLVSDGEDLSTPDLLRRTGQIMDKKVILFDMPTPLLKISAALVGKQAITKRLCNSLQVDITKTHNLLNWFPPYTIDQALKKTIESMK